MKLIFINKDNRELDLLNNGMLVITAAEALHGIDVSYAESESPYIDGTYVENARALPRGIALTFRTQGNTQAALDLFTSIVKSKQIATLRETNNNNREIEIKGFVKVPPYTRFTDAVSIQLELYCNQPYWEDVDEIVGAISEIIDLMYLPVEGRGITATGVPYGVIDTNKTKVFNNDGDVAVGMTIDIMALDEVVNPKISCSSGTQNGSYMQLGRAGLPFIMHGGDEVIISTYRGNKYITYNGLKVYNDLPIMQYLTFVGDDWLQLETGDNEFVIDTDDVDSNVYFNLIYKRRYE